MKYLTIIVIMITFLLVSTFTINANAQEPISYPYYASKQRVDQIKGNYKNIVIGMLAQKVKEILGEPDETTLLYEAKIYKPKQIGYSDWYLIQRKADKGSQKEKDEKLVRIIYNLNWKVIRVDHWGFDEVKR